LKALERKRVNSEIEKELKEDIKRIKNWIKILLLCCEDSGKVTVAYTVM
jgi:hypothetical protein